MCAWRGRGQSKGGEFGEFEYIVANENVVNKGTVLVLECITETIHVQCQEHMNIYATAFRQQKGI